MEYLKKIVVLTFSLLSFLSGALAQELPFYEVEYGLKNSPGDYNTSAGISLWRPPAGTGNSIDITNYLIASETKKDYADSLSGEGIPIGFNFPYAGETFDIFGVSSKGYIVLGKREEGLKIYADTLRYEANDTVFTKRNSFLISGLMFGKEMNKVNTTGIGYKNYGFQGKKSLSISFNFAVNTLSSSGYSLKVPASSIILYEDGCIVIQYGTTYTKANVNFSTLAFLTQRYGKGKDARFWADTLNGNLSYENLQKYYGPEERFGLFTNAFYPEWRSDGSYTLTFIPKLSSLAQVQSFTWDLQGRQGKSTGYYDNDHSLLQDDTISTSNTV